MRFQLFVFSKIVLNLHSQNSRVDFLTVKGYKLNNLKKEVR
jgi:hypothetical protein